MAGEELRDFEIRIYGKPKEGEPFDVSVRLTPEDSRADGTFTSPYTEAETTRALGWMEQGSFDADYVKEFGAALFEALFTGEVKRVYDSLAATGGPVRFRLVVDDAGLARIPWELLYDARTGAFLALNDALVRSLSMAEATNPLHTKRPLRVLVVDSFPEGVAKVDAQVEAEGIRKALSGLDRLGRVEVQTLSKVTLSKLQDRLREAADPEDPRPFHVLHYIGHGRYDPKSGETFLLFETESGAIDEVDPEALANVVGPYDLKLIFLNACQSMQSSALDQTQGFAPALLRRGIPSVIGMQVTVLDELALRFSKDFYAALADNQPVDVALAEARRLARGSKLRRKADLGIPVSYLRAASGRIFDLADADRIPLTRRTWKIWARRNLSPKPVLAAVSTLIGLIASVIGVVQWLDKPPPPRLRGDFNIAVAAFTEQDASGTVKFVPNGVAEDLSFQLFENLNRELQPLQKDAPQMPILPPADTGAVLGQTAADRAAAAQRLSALYNADLVVYGTVQEATDPPILVPEFFLADRRLSNAQELGGVHGFGNGEDLFVGGGPADLETRARLAARAKALADFVTGLSYMSVNQYGRAAEFFRAAQGDEGWEETHGKEVVYLFLGNALGALGDIASAGDAYDHALELNPDYARARLGVAEVQFQRARGNCIDPSTMDQAGLLSAEDAFRKAPEGPVVPPFSDIEIKSTHGIARVDFCLGQTLMPDRLSQAEKGYRTVLDAYLGGNKRIKQLAADASAGLGFIHVPAGPDAPGAAEQYRRSLSDYRLALDLVSTTDLVRRAYWHDAEGFLLTRLGDDAEAQKAYAKAKSLRDRAAKTAESPAVPGEPGVGASPPP